MSKDQASSKKIGALRKQMGEQLNIKGGLFAGISQEVEKKLQSSPDEYRDFRRIQNERDIETIKGELRPYISNKNFDIKIKAATIYLNAMILQNRMWGLNIVPETKPYSSDPPVGIKSVTSSMVLELRKIAKRQNPALPAAINASDTRAAAADNGTPHTGFESDSPVRHFGLSVSRDRFRP